MDFKNAMIFTERFRFESGAFSVEDGRFTSVLGTPGADAVDLEGAYVIPGLVDLHTHGNSGCDFSDGSFEGLLQMARYNASCGITSFAPTSLTAPVEVISKAFATARQLYEAAPAGAAAIRGIHMEGPFFCEARKGSQNANYLQNPDYSLFRELNEGCGRLIRIVALAPELPGAESFIRKASRDCTVSIAHTDADYNITCRAIEAGATQLTHLYNAMRGVNHRKPGPIIAAAEAPQVYAELISDGLHVHPAAVRFAFRVFGPERTILISDSIRCCGMPDGEYDLGGQTFRLKNGVARLLDGTIAGSSTNIYDCMLRAISFGVPKEDALRAATWNPASQLGCLDQVGSIAVGKQADFVICDHHLYRKAVYVAGQAI